MTTNQISWLCSSSSSLWWPLSQRELKGGSAQDKVGDGSPVQKRMSRKPLRPTNKSEPRFRLLDHKTTPANRKVRAVHTLRSMRSKCVVRLFRLNPLRPTTKSEPSTHNASGVGRVARPRLCTSDNAPPEGRILPTTGCPSKTS